KLKEIIHLTKKMKLFQNKKRIEELSMGEPVLLFPKPKHFKWLKENKVLNGVLDFKIPNKMTEIMNTVHFQGRLNQLIGNDNGVRIQVHVVNNSDVHPQRHV